MSLESEHICAFLQLVYNASLRWGAREWLFAEASGV